ncbi:uroporphyrinogen decarboxylase family protein [Neomoorella carbonis]|uniref:uroporphyrinogen decarboxylase family protein n=1 Tax=Neomoorella carbonis TaxID=3062783 RepID=UPI00324D6A5B
MKTYQEALQALRFKQTTTVPVVLWAIGQTYAPFAGIPDDEYYGDPDKMLNAQLLFHEKFADVFTVPGIWPDLGTVPELGALGAIVEFPNNAPPQIRHPALQDIQEVSNLAIPDPRNSPYTSQVLDYLKYFKKYLPQKLQDEYGYLDGHLFCMGPGEVSALMVGYDKFCYALVDYPELVHELLRKVTDFVKEYLIAQMEIVGPAKRVIVVDHFPGMISAPMYKEFIHPYLNEIFILTQEAEIRLYHNENNYPHLVNYIKDLGANVCHIGYKHNLREDKEKMGKCLMGNVHPIIEMLEGSASDLRKRCQEIIKSAGKGGGLWLSTAGGMAPETPPEKIKILIEVASETPV